MKNYKLSRSLIIIGICLFIIVIPLAMFFPGLGALTVFRVVVIPMIAIGLLLLYQTDITALPENLQNQYKLLRGLGLGIIILIFLSFVIILIVFLPGLTQ